MSSLLDKMYRRETVSGYDLSAVAKKYKLTGREVQLIEQLTRFRDNREIAEAMQVRDSTLQKHFQNIFRKLDVSSRWEIMRLLLEGDPRS
ncbi:MAG: response regulator transcription factor [Evtepia sp.]